VPVDEIKKSELLDYYTFDVRLWSNEAPIIVLDLKTKNNVKLAFYDFLGKTPSRMKSIWLKKMLSGECDPPESIKSEEAMLAKVASTPGAHIKGTKSREKSPLSRFLCYFFVTYCYK